MRNPSLYKEIVFESPSNTKFLVISMIAKQTVSSNHLLISNLNLLTCIHLQAILFLWCTSRVNAEEFKCKHSLGVAYCGACWFLHIQSRFWFMFTDLRKKFKLCSLLTDFDMGSHYLLKDYIFWSWVRGPRYCFRFLNFGFSSQFLFFYSRFWFSVICDPFRI